MKGWLYSAEKPEGDIFEGEDYSAKVEAGWVDSPDLIHEEKPKNKPGRPRVRP